MATATASKTAKKTASTKKATKKAAKVARMVIGDAIVNKIRKDLQAGKLTFKQIKEKHGLNSMTPIAHIKKNKMETV